MQQAGRSMYICSYLAGKCQSDFAKGSFYRTGFVMLDVSERVVGSLTQSSESVSSSAIK